MRFPTTHRHGRRRVNALVFVTNKIGPDVLPYLLQQTDLNIRVIADCSKVQYQEYMETGVSLENVHWIENVPQDPYRNQMTMQGHRLARWADFLFIIMDAGMVSLMLGGYTSDIILHVLRCWDVSKRIITLPELSVGQWKHPMWRRQAAKVQRKFDWITLLTPAIWDYSDDPLNPTVPGPNPLGVYAEQDMIWEWAGAEEIIETIHSEAQSVLRTTNTKLIPDIPLYLSPSNNQSSKPSLPSEIWTNVLDHLGDWELAAALGIYTHLSVPLEWQSLIPSAGSKLRTLEYTILTQPLSAIRSYFTSSNATSYSATALSLIATRLIFRFNMTELLTYLALHQKDIYYASFSQALLPHKASLIYNSPQILQWWRDCPAVIKKEYGPEALDGASRAGFVEVLEWWLNSDLPLYYTEKALESASAKGHVQVLEWWRTNSLKLAGTDRELPLKPGKAIILAAQSGRTESISWWENSGVPYTHEDGVSRLASQHGHVAVLDLWYSFKSSKMIFDNQVLVGATKNGHADILQWWKDASRKYGIRVEYKTCDIEEAMEDAVGGGGEGEVREWWSRNGLNLGVGTGEWMRVKTL